MYVGWLVSWVLWHINLCWLFNTKSIFIQINNTISNNSAEHKYIFQLSKPFLFQAIQFAQTVLIQAIQLRISIDFVYTHLNVKTVLFQRNKFNVSTISISKIVQTLPFRISPQQFYFEKFFLAAAVHSFDICDPLIGLYQVQPLRTIEDLGARQWRSALHSSKLQHYWNLDTRLFSVIFRALVVRGVLSHCKDAVGVFLPTGQINLGLFYDKCLENHVYCTYIFILCVSLFMRIFFCIKSNCI